MPAHKSGLGVVAEKNKLAWTLVTADALGNVVVVEEQEITAPASQTTRGAQLDWFLTEAHDLLARIQPTAIALRRPGDAAARERIEVEGVFQVAAHRLGIPVQLMTTESVRSRLGVAKGKDAFKGMLLDPDVAARSNAAKRERYLFAKAALRL